VKWTYCKPPIHGWALGWMLTHGMEDVDREKLRWLYPRLERWTRWWLDNRDSDGDGLCEYHHGNDSGWDNSTVFDGGFPAAGPDLAGFLIMQMDTLSDLAQRLDLPGDVEAWKERADAMLARLCDRLWTGEQFVTRRAFTDEVWPKGDSLINFLPIVLGKRLPEKYRDRLAEALKPDGRFVTAHGPATESPASDEYLSHGYWRGPIWGPETVIIVDGLWRAGYREQAAEIARRYCDMCRSCGIFAENYDALTGQPLCDPAYTWGSSAYLILASTYLPR
jgi:glycogen debranching enzyme